MCFKKNS